MYSVSADLPGGKRINRAVWYSRVLPGTGVHHVRIWLPHEPDMHCKAVFVLAISGFVSPKAFLSLFTDGQLSRISAC